MSRRLYSVSGVSPCHSRGGLILIYWPHLKTETEYSLRKVVFYNSYINIMTASVV
jgi:hypothetical protein